jgi:hypothetical protein
LIAAARFSRAEKWDSLTRLPPTFFETPEETLAMKQNQEVYLLTWDQAAKLLGKSKPTISRLVKDGSLLTNGESRKKLRIIGTSVLNLFLREAREEEEKRNRVTPFIRRLLRGTPKDNFALIESRKRAEIQAWLQFKELIEQFLREETQALTIKQNEWGRFRKKKEWAKQILVGFEEGQRSVLKVIDNLHRKYVSK